MMQGRKYFTKHYSKAAGVIIKPTVNDQVDSAHK